MVGEVILDVKSWDGMVTSKRQDNMVTVRAGGRDEYTDLLPNVLSIESGNLIY